MASLSLSVESFLENPPSILLTEPIAVELKGWQTKLVVLLCDLITEEEYHHGGRRETDDHFHVGRPSPDGRPIWSPSSPDLVGVQLGYYGAHHLLCDVRNFYRLFCLLRPH